MREQKIYVIGCEQMKVCKIGISGDVQKRAAALQTGFPFDLEIYRTYGAANAKAMEMALHNEYRRYSLRGEWFTTEVLLDIDEKVLELGGQIGGQTVKPIHVGQLIASGSDIWMFGDAVELEFDVVRSGTGVSMDGSKDCWEYLARALARVQMAKMATDAYFDFFLDRLFPSPPKSLRRLIKKAKLTEYPVKDWVAVDIHRQMYDAEFVFDGIEYVVRKGQAPKRSEYQLIRDQAGAVSR